MPSPCSRWAAASTNGADGRGSAAVATSTARSGVMEIDDSQLGKAPTFTCAPERRVIGSGSLLLSHLS